MLVLSREKDESIVIGVDGDIVITVVRIRRDKVRLGIAAPREIPVHRLEIWERIRRQGGREKKKGKTEKQGAEERDTPDAPQAEPDPRSFLEDGYPLSSR